MSKKFTINEKTGGECSKNSDELIFRWETTLSPRGIGFSWVETWIPRGENV